jgi:hypothetical protein
VSFSTGARSDRPDEWSICYEHLSTDRGRVHLSQRHDVPLISP